jgi:hypothetical protein
MTRASQREGDREDRQQRVDAIEDAAVAGQQALLSLAPALRLTSDSNRSPTTLIATRKTTTSAKPRSDRLV